MTVAALGPLQMSALKSGATDLIATRGEAPNHVPVTPNVIGVDELLAKKSAVDQSRKSTECTRSYQSLSL